LKGIGVKITNKNNKKVANMAPKAPRKQRIKTQVVNINTRPTVANVSGVSVAAKTDTKPQAPNMVAINDPAAAIRDNGAEFYRLYAQYLTLRAVALPLNGLPQNNLIPPALNISKISIEFTTDGQTRVAEIQNVTHIAEVAAAIGAGLRRTIDQMYQTLHTINHVATNMQNVVQQAATQKNTAVSLSNKVSSNEKTVQPNESI
jgi:hypothetical protein